jgi:hypothetical protein
MSDHDNTQLNKLLETIRSKRRELAEYVARREPRLLLLKKFVNCF